MIKRLILILMILSVGVGTNAQIIDSITYSPKNPTWEDSITVYCHARYPNVGCALVSQEVYGVGWNFIAKAFHCDGFLTMLCPTVDSFKVKAIDGYPGTYTFYYMPGFHLDSSQCNIPVMGNGDTIPYPYAVEFIEITVADPTNSVEHKGNDQISFDIYPNPTTGLITVTGLPAEPVRITVYNILGELVYDQELNGSNEPSVDLSAFPDGLYLVQLESGQMTFSKKVIKQ